MSVRSTLPHCAYDEATKETFDKFMNGNEVQQAITRHLRQEVYEESQEASS